MSSPFTVVPLGTADANNLNSSEALRDSLRGVIWRFEHLTIAEILGVLTMLEYEMLERLKKTKD